LIYLVALLSALAGAPRLGKLMLDLLAFYGVAVLVQVTALALRNPVLRSLAALPLIVLTHILYGWGFWRGLFTKLPPASERTPTAVVLERINPNTGNSVPR
jgi:hypothetical protein